ncbi:GNAT family N-acetyltransferase [Streptomyces sp. NRRL S-481]|uniref:GNAT family N-acetyltransferase n=1 Tax=Streptomyces sp. NRRL S-481 TaxID=1463911 RepID=UPI0004C95932|nr:GNAT family N-acetyltransferase [Streptomyces sp. NRRL S-481]
MTFTKSSTLAGLTEAWQRAARPASLYATAEWLVCNENGAGDDSLRYVLDADRPGAMVARKIPGGGFLGSDPLWLLFHPQGTEMPTVERGELATAVNDMYPLAAAALPGSYLPGLLGGEAVQDWTPLLAALEETARDWFCPSTGVLNVPDGHPAVAALREHGYVPIPSFAQAVMTVKDQSLEDYVARFHRRGRVRRARVLREMRDFEQAGLKIREVGLDDFDATHAALHLRQLQRYGHDFSAEWLVGLVQRSARYLGPWARMAVAERNGAPEAFTICYVYGNELHVKMSGFSEYAEMNSGYFYMIFYDVLAYAQRVRVNRIEYGPLTYEAKVGRGCALESRSNYLKVSSGWSEVLAEAASLADRDWRGRLTEIERTWKSVG